MNAYISDMVRVIDTSSPLQQSQLLPRFGQNLFVRPDMCAELIREATTGPLSDGQMELLISALESARMADENGQRKGRAFLDAMSDEVALLDTKLTAESAFSLSSAWSRAGLTPPTSLAHSVIPEDPDAFADTYGIPEIPDELFDEAFKGITDIGEQSVSAMLALLDEMLPTMPPEARFAFIRKLTTRADPLCGEAASALLLSTDASLSAGALAGLALRQKAGNLSQHLFSRLTLIRSWVQDPDTLRGIDEITRAALMSGAQASSRDIQPKIHRVVSSMIDGSGGQNIAIAIQSGKRRTLALVLLKQGFGVKDAFTIPCSSATEQKKMLGQIIEQSDALEVTAEYAFTALSWALADGQSNGSMPAAGLLDVVETAGLGELRPRTADISAIVDPEGEISNLSSQARGRLIMASEHWPDMFPISDSWFENNDASSNAIESATTRNRMKRNLWQHMETRRDFWTMIFARNAALLMAANNSAGPEFIAVARGLAEGRDLKKTPIMQSLHELSLEIWFIQGDGSHASGANR